LLSVFLLFIFFNILTAYKVMQRKQCRQQILWMYQGIPHQSALGKREGERKGARERERERERERDRGRERETPDSG
jgi:hypothetical protein